MITIDDFVMLGKTVPEPNSDGRVFVCSAGISPTLRTLIRIYPLARFGAPARWSVSTVRLERNPKDWRRESFQIAADRRPGVHDKVNNAFMITGECAGARRSDLLKPYTVDSIDEANAKKLSLAVLHPNGMDLDFDTNPDSPDSPQLALFDVNPVPEAGAKRFPYIPRLRFRDDAGPHHLMLRDWGIYELMRKNGNLVDMSTGERCRFVRGALSLDASSSLLIGNFNRYPTSWLIISVLRGLRAAPSLFDELSTEAFPGVAA